MLDCNPVTVSGDVAPDAVKLPGDEVTVNDVIGAPFDPPDEKETLADPLLNARPVPTFVADTLIGALGFPAPWKPRPLTPAPLPPIIGICYSPLCKSCL